MGNIPTIPGTAPVSTQQVGIKVDAGPRIAALQGVQRLAEATYNTFSEAAGVITAIEDRKRQAEDMAAFNQASIVMRQTTSTYRDQIAHDADYNSYVPKWQQVATGVRDQVLQNSNLKGQARRQMQMALDSWQAETTSEFQHAADIRGTNDRRTIATLAAEKAYQEGNLAAGNAAIDGAVKVGDMWPEVGARLKQTGTRTAELSQIETGIRVDPARLMEDIDKGTFKNVTQHQLETAKIQARAQVARNQHDAFLGMYEDLSANPMMMTDDRIDAAVEQKTITPTGAAALKRARSQANRAEARDDYNSLWMMVDSHDFTKDQVPEEAAKDFTTAAGALPPEFARPLFTHIQEQVKKAKSAQTVAEHPVESQMLQLMREDRENVGAFIPLATKTTVEKHWFSPNKTITEQVPFDGGLAALRRELMGTADQPGMKQEDIEALFGKGATAKSIMDAEQTAFAKQYNAMREWFKTPQGQKATFEEANAMRKQLEAPLRSAAASTVMERAKQLNMATFSTDDQKALQWANTHPTDPKATDAWNMLIAKYGKAATNGGQ